MSEKSNNNNATTTQRDTAQHTATFASSRKRSPLGGTSACREFYATGVAQIPETTITTTRK